jgi:Ankyrin repeat
MRLRLLVAALALAAGAGASAQELPKPSPVMQKELDSKGIVYPEWLLFYGLRSGNADYIAAALDSGLDLNKARNPIGELPPLMVAVSNPAARADIVALLVKHGADVNQRWTPKSASGTQGTGFFPLYQAARLSNAETIEALIKHGADVKARVSHGGTALHNTFDVNIGMVLVRHGAEINARNHAGQTPLAIAKRALAELDRQPNPELRRKVAAFHAWLRTQGAVE